MNQAFKVIARAVKRDGEIIPSFLSGTNVEGRKVSTELARRCRELFKSGHLDRIRSYPYSEFRVTKKGLKYFTGLLKK